MPAPHAGAIPQRRVPATYAGKATTPPPPAVSRSKRSLISSSNTASDAETIEHLQEEVGDGLGVTASGSQHAGQEQPQGVTLHLPAHAGMPAYARGTRHVMPSHVVLCMSGPVMVPGYGARRVTPHFQGTCSAPGSEAPTEQSRYADCVCKFTHCHLHASVAPNRSTRGARPLRRAPRRRTSTTQSCAPSSCCATRRACRGTR